MKKEVPYIIFGTSNKNKAIEATAIVASSGVRFITLAEVDGAIDVVEDGTTFAENARKKAIEQALNLKEWTLAEDSGICVDYLGGAPGVYSARYAGADERSDARNNEKLLADLAGVPLEKRGAHYACHMVLADPEGNVVFETEQQCRGRVLFEESGVNGFGYDPLFEVIEYHKTFGDLAPIIKSAISHRARATRLLVPVLCRLVAEKKLPTRLMDVED
ncbi:MAG: non-canonical purine NTP pyrophosphatase [Thermoguttaceae bacterium]|nr:non-canonical purine NTP pyrophosphatase [Thermoguttaceae bacterium]